MIGTDALQGMVLELRDEMSQYRHQFGTRRNEFITEAMSCGMSEKEARSYAIQSIGPVVPVECMPTLAPGKTRPLSPLLAARYRYAGGWKDIGEHLLLPAEVLRIARTEQFRGWISDMRNYWVESAPYRFGDDRLSLLSVANEEAGHFSMLVWKEPGEEPEVWTYASQHEYRFSHLLHWFKWLNGRSEE
ncbi:hypothetical protein [Paenibacillus kribbensis]|uniref:hypothetical protein n=1 Tax=Paenibacillus kribbensis TaxID=172713 RepID=UPI000837AC7B|nr:hypothetical protein [Paenibacillus kribbensis]